MDSKPAKCGDHGHRNKSGTACRNSLVPGGTACYFHAGKARKVAKAEGQVRIELARWGTDDTYVDPAEQFLRLIAQSARRCEFYSELLQADYQDRKVSALVGTSWGEGGPSGEYLRGLAELEARERAFCAKLCSQAISAGIEARRVELAARQVDVLDRFTRGLLVALGADPDAPEVRALVAGQLRQIDL